MSVVYVYSQPDCQPCKLVTKMFENADVNYRVIDISKDSLMRDYVTQHLGARSTPVVEAEGFPVVVGFKPDAITEIIEHYSPVNKTDLIHDYVYEGDELDNPQ